MDRTLWFVGPRAVELRPASPPPLDVVLGDGQARVRTIYSGISSGTEMLAYRGQLPRDMLVDQTLGALGGVFTYPFQYGYSCVGRIEQLATGAAGDVSVGDLVFAFAPHQDRFIADVTELVSIADLAPRQATLLPYIETAWQVSLDAGPVLGETVVVSGLGIVGLLVAIIVERAGATVVGIEPKLWRRQFAGRLGIDAIDPGDVADLTTNIPLAIECSGNPAALRTAVDLLAHEGRLLVASWYGSQPVTLDLGGAFHRRRLTIQSTQVSTIPAAQSGRWTHDRRLRHAVDLAATLPLEQLATHTVAFDDAGSGYALVDAATQGVVHVAFGYD